MKASILLNRHAGGGHSDRTIDRVLARAKDIEVATPSTREELDVVAREIRASRIDRLGVIGGDGTIHAVLSALARADDSGPMPTIALLGGGTLNTIARSVGVRRRSLGSAIERFRSIATAESIVTTERSTMRCNGAVGSLFGVGVVETFLRSYYATGAPNAWTATKLLATGAFESVVGGPTFRSFTERTNLRVVLADGEDLGAMPTLSVAAGTVADLGLGFRPFHRVEQHPSSIHLVRYHGDASSLVRALPRIRFAKPLDPTIEATERTTRGFTIHAETDTLGYMFDGDLYVHEGSSLEVGLGPTIRYATLEEPTDAPSPAPISGLRRSTP